MFSTKLKFIAVYSNNLSNLLCLDSQNRLPYHIHYILFFYFKLTIITCRQYYITLSAEDNKVPRRIPGIGGKPLNDGVKTNLNEKVILLKCQTSCSARSFMSVLNKRNNLGHNIPLHLAALSKTLLTVNCVGHLQGALRYRGGGFGGAVAVFKCLHTGP